MRDSSFGHSQHCNVRQALLLFITICVLLPRCGRDAKVGT